MNTIDNSDAFETLDPQDWEQSKALMHKMIDDAFDYIQNVRDRKIWQDMPEDVLDTFKTSIPQQPSKAEDVYKELEQNGKIQMKLRNNILLQAFSKTVE